MDQLGRLSGIDFGTLGNLIPNQPYMFPSDLDGFIEVSGHMLVIEGKEHDGSFGIGQYRMLEHLSKMPHTTVYVCVLDSDNKTSAQAVRFAPYKIHRVGGKGEGWQEGFLNNRKVVQPIYTDTSLEEFRKLYLAWYTNARANPQKI